MPLPLRIRVAIIMAARVGAAATAPPSHRKSGMKIDRSGQGGCSGFGNSQPLKLIRRTDAAAQFAARSHPAVLDCRRLRSRWDGVLRHAPGGARAALVNRLCASARQVAARLLRGSRHDYMCP